MNNQLFNVTQAAAILRVRQRTLLKSLASIPHTRTSPNSKPQFALEDLLKLVNKEKTFKEEQKNTLSTTQVARLFSTQPTTVSNGRGGAGKFKELKWERTEDGSIFYKKEALKEFIVNVYMEKLLKELE